MGTALLGTAPTRRRIASLTIGLLLIAFALGASSASAATLFGTVSSQTPGQTLAPAAGASVTVSDAQGGAVVALGTAGLDGSYSLAIPAGTYDVRFDPPAGGDFAPSTVHDIQVDTTRKLDVVLLPSGLVRLSGVVSGPNGPLADVHLTVYAGDASGETVGAAVTGVDGAYSFALSSGSYFVRTVQTGHPAGVPGGWEAEAAFALSGDRSWDLTLPPVRSLTVHVVGEGEAPVAGARVIVPPYIAQATVSGVPTTLSSSTAVATTDAAGDVAVPEFDGAVDPGQGQQVLVTPAAGSSYGQQAVPLPTIAGDTTLVVRLQRTVELSGVVRGAGGPVAGVNLYLNAGDGSGTEYGRTVTAPDGSYAFAVSPGRYELHAAQSGAPAWLPPSWEADFVLEVSDDRAFDVVLPSVQTFTVRVRGDDESPVPDARVLVSPYVAHPSVAGAEQAYFASSTAVTRTDGDGDARVLAFDGSADPGDNLGIDVTPPADSPFGQRHVPLPPIEGDTTLVVQLARKVALTGVVSGPDGPLAAVHLYLFDDEGRGIAFGEAVTGPDGSYAFGVPPGRYFLRVTQAGRPAGVPLGWEAELTVDVPAARTFDVVLPPLSTLTVRVVHDGVPVADAQVEVPPYGLDLSPSSSERAFYSAGTVSARTDAAGEIHMAAFDGSVEAGEARPVIVTPPAASELGQQSVPAPAIHGDTTLIVQYGTASTPDTTAPAVACDPAPTGWHADEVSVACGASDSGSGLADPSDASFSLSTSVGDGNEDASAQTGTRQVCDSAGNCATAGPIGPIAVDRKAPALAFSQQPDGGNGWWISTPGSTRATASDLAIARLDCSLDGVPQALVPTAGTGDLALDVAAAGEGRHTVNCTATDAIGHTTTDSDTVRVDVTAPNAPRLTADRAPDYPSRGGWYRDTVTINVLGSGDPLLADGTAGSGVDPASIPAPTTLSTSGNHGVSGSVADLAGNASLPTTAVFRVDADPPQTTLTCPTGTVRRNARASARWRDRDGESGLATAGTGSIALDTSRAGTYTVQHTATDDVDHSASTSCTYTVA